MGPEGGSSPAVRIPGNQLPFPRTGWGRARPQVTSGQLGPAPTLLMECPTLLSLPGCSILGLVAPHGQGAHSLLRALACP